MNLHSFAKEIQNHEITGNEASNPEYKAHDGSFGTYFRNKQIKLDTQAKEKNTLQSEVFKDCIVYITGYTNPSAQKLKQLIVENGGQICAFLGGKTYCTHIIAASLTSRKENLYANMKVVKPAWVTESVKMGTLLPWSRYRTLSVPGNQVFAQKQNRSNCYEITETVPFAADEKDDSDDLQKPYESHDSNACTYDPSLLDIPGGSGDSARTAWILDQRSRVNCLEKSFLKEYFGKSRLHFLSTSKLELRNRCRKYISPYANSSSQKKRTLLHIDFDSFFVAVALKKRPNLIHFPVCVSHGSEGSDIASCNYVARKRGVKNGQWVAKARTLCPDLICLPYDFEEYTKCSNILYETLLKLLPDKISAISVDEAMIDVTHLAAARPVTDICALIRNKIREATGIAASIGSGNNILMSKLALKLAKPDGIYVCQDKSEIQQFGVKDLPGVGYHICSQLENLGIGTIQSLSKLSLSELQNAAGNAVGQRLHNYALGIDTDDIATLDVPIRTVGLEIGWGVRVVNEMEMLEFIDNCSLELLDRLERSGQDPDLLTVKIHIKSSQAPFVAPKFMGHGLCDIQSRSQSLVSFHRPNQIISCIHSLVRKIDCPPLLFRGIGLHVKVSDPIVRNDPQQSRILFGAHESPAKRRDVKLGNIGDNIPISEPQTPKKRPMVSIPPRKRHRASKTLTQLFVEDNDSSNNENSPKKVDASVLSELPTQIRREIVMNEEDYLVPQDFTNKVSLFQKSRPVPLFEKTAFLGTTDEAKLRDMIREWVKSTPCPTREDAQAFSTFLCTSIQNDSAWAASMELFDYFKVQIKIKSSSDSWTTLQELIENKIQDSVKTKLAKYGTHTEKAIYN